MNTNHPNTAKAAKLKMIPKIAFSLILCTVPIRPKIATKPKITINKFNMDTPFGIRKMNAVNNIPSLL